MKSDEINDEHSINCQTVPQNNKIEIHKETYRVIYKNNIQYLYADVRLSQLKTFSHANPIAKVHHQIKSSVNK